jgi:hypothetical protein
MPRGRKSNDTELTNDDALKGEDVSHESKREDRVDLVALFRLLLRNPPREHDFEECPICKRHGITGI